MQDYQPKKKKRLSKKFIGMQFFFFVYNSLFPCKNSFINLWSLLCHMLMGAWMRSLKKNWAGLTVLKSNKSK